MFSCRKPQPTEEQKQQLRYKKEQDLLSYYDIQLGVDYEIIDVPVEYLGLDYTIHAFKGISRQTPLPTALLIHGYGGSNVHYGKIYKNLMKSFNVYSIDLPGMGFSSKANIEVKTKEHALGFFLSTIKAFIDKVTNNNKIVLVGHSFGGFIAAQLLVIFPELFSYVFLLSPAGTTYYDDNQIDKINDHTELPFLKRMLFKCAKNKWNQGITPKELNDKWYGKILVKRYLSKRMGLKQREYELWRDYVEELITLPEGSERSLFVLFQFRVIAKGWDSIEYQLIKNMKKIKDIPIQFQFGQYDWMDKKGAKNLARDYDNITLKIIPDAGHQLNFENPEYVVNEICSGFQDQMIFQQQ